MPTPARNLLLSCTAAALAAAVLAPSASATLPSDGDTAPPPAPAPSVQLHTVGLGSRDISLNASSTPRQVTLQPGDAFTAYATTSTAGANVRLRKTVTRDCGPDDPDEPAVIEQPLYGDTGFVSPPASEAVTVLAYPWNSCDPGRFLESVTITLAADARTSTGRASTPAATFTYTPWRLIADTTVTVPESTGCCNDGWRSTGLRVEREDRLQITGFGTIWAGVWFTGQNGPDGWYGTSAGPAYPLPGANQYGLIANLGDGANGPKFHVGSGIDAVPSIRWPAYGWPWFHLNLRTNDDVPGNGSGAFTAHVRLWRHD